MDGQLNESLGRRVEASYVRRKLVDYDVVIGVDPPKSKASQLGVGVESE